MYCIHNANNYMLYLCISVFVFMYLCIKHFLENIIFDILELTTFLAKMSGYQFSRGPIFRGPICRGPICQGLICRGPMCLEPSGSCILIIDRFVHIFNIYVNVPIRSSKYYFLSHWNPFIIDIASIL